LALKLTSDALEGNALPVARSLSDQFGKRISTLKNASAEDASGRLASILNWVEHEPVTRAIVAKLRKSVDEERIFPATRGNTERPPAHTPEEIAFVGLVLMENCRDRNINFLHVCIGVGIDPGNFDLMLEQGFHDYIYPFLQYIADELDVAGEQSSVEGVLEMRMTDILTGDLRQLTPDASTALAKVAKEFVSPSENTRWQNVGNSCRQILKEFVVELCSARGIPFPPDVQSGNFKELGKRLIQNGDSRGTTAKLIDAIWDHAQTITHRPSTTKDEALRVFVWTCLSASELARCVVSQD
jgi:hypothetical protein